MTNDLLNKFADEACFALSSGTSRFAPGIRGAVVNGIERLARTGVQNPEAFITFGILKGTEAIDALERGGRV